MDSKIKKALLLEKLRDAKVYKITRQHGQNCGLITQAQGKQSCNSKCSRENLDSRVRQTEFYSIEATHLETIQSFFFFFESQPFIWRKGNKTICLITQRWEFTLVCLKNLPQSRFWRSNNYHWKRMKKGGLFASTNSYKSSELSYYQRQPKLDFQLETLWV